MVLSKEERLHYGYQCHACMATEHDLLLLAGRDPDHPDVARLAASAIDLMTDGAGGITKRDRRAGSN